MNHLRELNLADNSIEKIGGTAESFPFVTFDWDSACFDTKKEKKK